MRTACVKCDCTPMAAICACEIYGILSSDEMPAWTRRDRRRWGLWCEEKAGVKAARRMGMQAREGAGGGKIGMERGRGEGGASTPWSCFKTKRWRQSSAAAAAAATSRAFESCLMQQR